MLLIKYVSWASGALDPERDAEGDVVTSVKRFGIFSSISTHLRILLCVQCAKYPQIVSL